MSDRTLPINTFEQISAGDVAVSYVRGETRMTRPNQARVWGRGFDTDPKGPWYNYGCKVFVGKRAESLPKALAWASETYGVKKWHRNAMGDYVDASKGYLPLRKRT